MTFRDKRRAVSYISIAELRKQGANRGPNRYLFREAVNSLALSSIYMKEPPLESMEWKVIS